MAEDVFKLPQSSYDTVCRILKAYAQVGEKTSLATVSKILGHDPTVISRNVGFLVSLGLLEGGRDKGPTASGMRLGRALEFDELGDVVVAWREVLGSHPLIQRILSAIRVRGGMDAATLQGQVVYTAGVKKTAGAMTGGAAVVEMMKAAELIVERDGRFIVPSVSEKATHDAVSLADDEPIERVTGPVVQRIVEVSAGGISVRLDVRIEVQATADELPKVGVGLRQLLAELQLAGTAGESDIPSLDDSRDAAS